MWNVYVQNGPAGMPDSNKICMVMDSSWPLVHIWSIAGPMEAGHVSDETSLSNQFC